MALTDSQPVRRLAASWAGRAVLLGFAILVAIYATAFVVGIDVTAGGSVTAIAGLGVLAGIGLVLAGGYWLPRTALIWTLKVMGLFTLIANSGLALYTTIAGSTGSAVAIVRSTLVTSAVLSLSSATFMTLVFLILAFLVRYFRYSLDDSEKTPEEQVLDDDLDL